jgi:hypothetical protein
MIIKLATFESEVSELEKEAGFTTHKALWASLPDKAKAILTAAGMDAKTIGAYGGGRATALGSGAGKAVDAVLGGNASGTLAGKTNKAADFIKRNKAGIAGGALAGGGILAYKSKKK